ncbi:MAG: hypothetical protein LBO04_05740 [Spirochaetaceae bacterium]|jgi:hypothetical protein|nr:hypothetical protein [Spirochaetaceae bacterium]
MWQNVKSVIAFFCILIYIGAAAFAGIKIYEAVNEQRFNARQEFDDLTDLASRAGAFGFFTREYIGDLKTQFDMSKTLDALIVYGPEGAKFAFEKRAGLISYKDDYPGFNKKIKLYRAPQNAPLRAEGNLNVSISAISPVLDFNTLLSILRSSMLAILVAVCVAFFTLIADVSMIEAASETRSSARPAPDPVEDGDTFESSVGGFDDFLGEMPGGEADIDGEPVSPAGEAPQDGDADAVEEPEALTDESPQDGDADAAEEPDALTDESPQDGDADAAEEPDVLTDESPQDGDADAVEEPDVLTDESPQDGDADLGNRKEPPGLGLLAAANALYQTDGFDNNGGIPEFRNILQDELNKAEAGGGDLVLLNIEWTTPGLSCKPLIKQAASFFSNGSRFFEKDGQEGLYITVPGCSLDEAFVRAKEFHRHAREKKPQEVYAELLIGMTARSLRSVGASSFLNEAEHALDKARMDSALPIVAFKVDPEKYNEYARRLGHNGT